MMGWRGLSKYRETVKEASDQTIRKVALAAFQALISRSPVDTGRFRGNWRTAVNWVDKTTDEEIMQIIQQGSPMTGAELQNVEPGMKAVWGDNVYISNDLPYAEPLENGHSPQAPTGVLHVTAAEIRAKIKGGAV